MLQFHSNDSKELCICSKIVSYNVDVTGLSSDTENGLWGTKSCWASDQNELCSNCRCKLQHYGVSDSVSLHSSLAYILSSPSNPCIFFKASEILSLNFLVGFLCSFLQQKLLGFLITVISVCRISELNALSITSSYLLFNIEMVVLNLMLVFVPKVNWNVLFSSCGKEKKSMLPFYINAEHSQEMHSPCD